VTSPQTTAPRAAAGRTGAASPTVELDGVSVFYGEVVGLSRVSLQLSPGITGIVGPNGSGKSTLMRVLTGLIATQEGTARVLSGNPFHDETIRARIGFVPATECFYDNLSGRSNLEAAFLARGVSTAAARELAARALKVIRLEEDAGRAYRTWSRGMRQRLKLGVALVHDESELVLLDEPFLGVDPPSRRQLRDLILELAGQGRTVLVSSHVLHEIESLTDQVGVLAHGRLLGFGQVEELLRDLRDRHPHRIELTVDDPRRLGALIFSQPHVREVRVAGADRLVFVTERPESFYETFPRLVVDSGCLVRGMITPDNALEAVFTHVTATGTRRL